DQQGSGAGRGAVYRPDPAHDQDMGGRIEDGREQYGTRQCPRHAPVLARGPVRPVVLAQPDLHASGAVGVLRTPEQARQPHRHSPRSRGVSAAIAAATVAAIRAAAPPPGPPPSSITVIPYRGGPSGAASKAANQPLSARPGTCAVPVFPARRQPVPATMLPAERAVPRCTTS